MPDPDPTWQIVDAMLKTVQIGGTLYLGYLIWKISKRQADTAEDKLKLDLFDRRYRVYRSFEAFINDAQGRVIPSGEFTRAVRRLDRGQFLFDDKTWKWMMDVRRDLRAMNNARRIDGEIRNDPSEADLPRYREASREYGELTQKLDRILEELPTRFKKHLDFSKTLGA